MKTYLLMLTCLCLTSCVSYYNNRPQDIAAKKIQNSLERANKCEGFFPLKVSISSSCLPINHSTLVFTTPRKITLEEARQAIVSQVNCFLSLMNTTSDMSPFLGENSFTEDNVTYTIMCTADVSNEITTIPYVMNVKLEKGIIRYRMYYGGPVVCKDNVAFYEESYQEALAILQSSLENHS